MQSTTDKKKVKKIFKTKKGGSITCSKLIINEFAGSPTRSENAYFAIATRNGWLWLC